MKKEREKRRRGEKENRGFKKLQKSLSLKR
jgi:hypothetical protein